ncbi:hypothetical protein CLOSTASPAR_05191, partial [[Clostridium] asparagiforme DSM 15981]
MLTLPQLWTSGLSRPLCSFFSLRWARYLEMAAFSSRPVNLLPLMMSVSVRAQYPPACAITLLSVGLQGGKAGAGGPRMRARRALSC